MVAEDTELREFVNDENNFKNLLFLFGHPDGEEYIDRVLPLLDPEKIALLLSKDERVVDKVYHLSRQPGNPIAEVVQTIYDTRTNQALVNKLDGNALLEKLGFTDYGDFWFNTLATEDGLAELCAGLSKETGVMDVTDEPKRKQVLTAIRANFHWDVKKEHAFGLFASLTYALSKNPDVDSLFVRARNYLAAQLVRHKIEVTGMDGVLAGVDGVRDIRFTQILGVGAELSYDLTKVMYDFKEREKRSMGWGVSGSYIGRTGMSSFVAVTGFSMHSMHLSGTVVPTITRGIVKRTP